LTDVLYCERLTRFKETTGSSDIATPGGKLSGDESAANEFQSDF